jgi:uncharacterized membrane protein YdjX (TVP38/TMEM64 family)
VALVLATVAAVWALGGADAVSFATLRAQSAKMRAFIDQYPLLAPAAFAVFYAAVIVLLPPSGSLATVIGGYLFGAVVGTVAAAIGATAGATLVFLIARRAIGQSLRRCAGPRLRALEAGFRRDAASYLLVLRLLPLFPFWLVNIAPALLGVPLRTYVLTTAIGIIPGTFVYALFGAGLGSAIDRAETISLQAVMTPQILGALTGLAVLSLAPVLYKRCWPGKRDRAAERQADG